ncbi:MAG: DUF4340 domain-containing protein [Anaerolineae bacterium]|nr:DUF4340 domain-containing protein [Anaerolineae bacterium]
MRFRNTVILLLVFIALGGYTYFFEIKGNKGVGESTTGANTPIWDVEPAQVVQLDVSGPDGSTQLIREGTGPWYLVDISTKAKEPADDARVDRVVEGVAYARATRVFTNTADLKEYGLATPTWRASLHLQNGKVRTLQWGDKTPQGFSYYVKKDEENTVYIIASYVIEDLERLVREPAYPPTPTPTSSPTAKVLPTVSATGTPSSSRE